MKVSIPSTHPLKNFLSIFTVFVLIISGINTFGDTNSATAADLSQFNAGNIISDGNFYNGNAMTSAEVQTFLDSKVPTCTINNGDPSHAAGAAYFSTVIADVCLKNYRQATPSMAAQGSFCSAYQGKSSESAAEIITRVGLACNVSQKVLLVILQKEQSLVNDSWPTVRQFSQATGFACYDNGEPCVSGYSGFFYQVWSAARQLQRYGNAPFTWYPVGQTSNILFQANKPECGTKSVFIENRATAALYYYTPYTPNTAALAAGYGTGDACSAYGNRNFYQTYVDWFGSTQDIQVGSNLRALYSSLGGSSSFLGTAKTSQYCGLINNGCYQDFNGGSIYWSQASGAHSVKPAIFTVWATYRWESGQLGYPTSEATTSGAETSQTFQGGIISIKPGESKVAWFVGNRVKDTFNLNGGESGFLGKPTMAQYCGLRNDGCYQNFAGGTIYWSPTTGSHPIKPAVYSLWSTMQWEFGRLGYPTGDPVSTPGTNGDYTQAFYGGLVSVNNGIATLVSPVNDFYVSLGAGASFLGAPKTAEYCGTRGGGCYRDYTNGSIYWSPTTGAHSIKPSAFALWSKNQWEFGKLGYPTSEPELVIGSNSTYVQSFEGGFISVSGSTAQFINPIGPRFKNYIASNGGINSNLGLPKMAEYCGLKNGGCYQDFTGGSLYWTPTTGAHAIKPAVFALWSKYQWEFGKLGYPTGDATPIDGSSTDYTQTFEGGTVQVINGTAEILYLPGTHFNDYYLAHDGALGFLGLPKMAEYCGLKNGGCYQDFTGGSLYWTPTTGAHAIKPAVFALWSKYQWEFGKLGYPTGDATPIDGSSTDYTQTFEGGTVQVINGTAEILYLPGTHFNDYYLAHDGALGFLGLPKMAEYCGLKNGGCYQDFTGGSLYWTPTTGAHAIKPAVFALWSKYQWEFGKLGYPTGDATPIDGSSTDYTQTFEGGTIIVRSGLATIN